MLRCCPDEGVPDSRDRSASTHVKAKVTDHAPFDYQNELRTSPHRLRSNRLSIKVRDTGIPRNITLVATTPPGVCVVWIQVVSTGRVLREQPECGRLRLGRDRWDVVPMASGTRLWSGLVEDDFLTLYELNLLVTLSAGDVAMGSLQREHRLFMIEERRSPLGRVVALGAPGHLVGSRELRGVGILVAIFALFGCLAEVDVFQCHLEVRRTMAFGTARCAVSPGQREASAGVIERGNFLPGFGRVAQLATT